MDAVDITPKPKRGEPGFICECKLCLQHKEIQRIQALLPAADAAIFEDLWSIAEHELFDMEWNLHTLEERWKLKYEELETRLANVMLI